MSRIFTTLAGNLLCNRSLRTGLLALVFLIMLARFLIGFMSPSVIIVPITAFPQPDLRLSNGSMYTDTFPKRVHVMWKSTSSPPPETIHWQQGCHKVNADMSFSKYNDEDLLAFVTSNYPNYLPMFAKLRGVHMADMARVLITYHFGGLYMDLDFYCVRPFHCIHQLLPPHIHPKDDILVVSLETRMHSTVFRQKERVVIQDFFYATPRHPFFRFMLDDRMAKFNADIKHSAKGPFGYHIEEDIDAFWASPAAAARGPSGRRPVVFELRDDVLHSLGDATHSALNRVCYASDVPQVRYACVCMHASPRIL